MAFLSTLRFMKLWNKRLLTVNLETVTYLSVISELLRSPVEVYHRIRQIFQIFSGRLRVIPHVDMRKIVAATYRVLATVHVASGKNIFLSERHFYQDLKILAKLGHVSLQEISEKNRININILLTRLRVVFGKTISPKIIFYSLSRIFK